MAKVTREYIGEIPFGKKLTKTFAKQLGRDRRCALPKYFTGSLNGLPLYAVLESTVYSFMRKILKGQYSGGYWKFCSLSNGGFYMTLDSDNVFNCDSEGFQTEYKVSADAASIVANCMAYSYLSLLAYEKDKVKESELLGDRYYQLKDYIANHLEAKAIYAIID